MLNISICFNQSKGNYSELDFSLGSPEPTVCFDDDFEPSYSARPDLNEDMYLASLDQETNLPMSLSLDLVSLTSLPKNVTAYVFAYADPPVPFSHSREFKVGDDLEILGGLDMSTGTEVKHHDLDDSEDISHELYDEVTEPIILNFDDDIPSIEYESFSSGLDVNVSLDVDLYAEYESFSFDPVEADLLF